jgi:mono/diheme cytochrome c family protein
MNTIIRTTILAAALLIPATTTTMAAGAAKNYSKKCASCHGKDGSGKTKMGKKSGARDYRSAKVQGSFSDAEGIAAIKNGVKKKGKEKMKAYASKYSEAEIKALLQYVRAFKK